MTLFKVTFYLSDGKKTSQLINGDSCNDVSSVVNKMLKDNDFIDHDGSTHNFYLSFRSSSVMRYLVEKQ